MKQFTLQINKNYQRPIVELKTWHYLEALLDTGAFFPIWTAGESALEKVGGTLVKRNIHFGGFGGEAIGNLDSLRSFSVGQLMFPNMSIIAYSDLKDVPFQLILSATIFSNLIYEIDDKNHKFNVTIPDGESGVRNLVIKDSGGKLHVLCN